jgi:hypothetical protein
MKSNNAIIPNSIPYDPDEPESEPESEPDSESKALEAFEDV